MKCISCKNCGAAIEGNKCTYCKSIYYEEVNLKNSINVVTSDPSIRTFSTRQIWTGLYSTIVPSALFLRGD